MSSVEYIDKKQKWPICQMESDCDNEAYGRCKACNKNMCDDHHHIHVRKCRLCSNAASGESIYCTGCNFRTSTSYSNGRYYNT